MRPTFHGILRCCSLFSVILRHLSFQFNNHLSFIIYQFLSYACWGTKSPAPVTYPSGQDGTILPARDNPLYSHARKCCHINKSFMAHFVCYGYWRCQLYICVFMDPDDVSVHKHVKNKNLGPYPFILPSPLVNKPYLLKKI